MADKHYRWETGRAIVTHMLPSLPSASYAAVVMYCWFHAEGKESEFQESCHQIANACKLSPRQVRRILSDLEKSGCIETVKVGFGMTPSTRKLKRRKYSPPKGADMGDRRVGHG